ncbi:sensor histidine kinase [Anaerovorax sp. IOR16]|uniref:sensor histidine kinase n=1 Tax=Anaerovorax sp. IOR16 TaxID=2773458 RepID=UPI0019D13392|nr:ATP-binding protein [Anaerovorax sp. IOR16]
MNKNEFTTLKLKLILRIVGSVFFAAIAALLVLHLAVDGFLQEPVADFADQLGIYHLLLKLKIPLIILMIVVFLLFGIFLAMDKLSYYLNAVSRGIDQVFDEQKNIVELPDGLEAMEKKLNRVKYDLQKRQLEAKQSEQQKNDLVVYLAHDLRTPMTSILGYLSLLDAEKDMAKETKEKYSNIVYEKAKRMELLLDELFEITRFNATSMELIERKVNLNIMLEQLIEEFYPLMAEKELTYKVIQQENVELIADSDQLARVFDNLLRNAVVYSEPKTEILIELLKTDHSAIISFTNFGITIPKEKLERIFERFYRVEEARTTDSGGAGLGLAIAKKIVELHNGTIKSESENLKTVLTVELPLKKSLRK